MRVRLSSAELELINLYTDQTNETSYRMALENYADEITALINQVCTELQAY